MTNPHVALIRLPPLPTNCYVIHTFASALIVDPGGTPEAVFRYLDARGLAPTHILLTHLHSDHTVGVAALAKRYAARVFASAKDAWMQDDYLGRGDDDWGIPPVTPFIFEPLGAGELPVLDTVCTVLETPGHSPGGLCFYFAGMRALFSGDTLFRRSAGRTDFSGGNPAHLADSLRKKLFRLPGMTRVYPGHGRDFLLKDCELFKQYGEQRR